MTGKKTRILVFIGGRSPEHDVSIITGLQALQALDPARYEAQALYIAPNGAWLVGDSLRNRETYIPNLATAKDLTEVTLAMGSNNQPMLLTVPKSFWQKPKRIEFDVAFLAFHGLIGEDGGIQGALETANVPYTGMRLLASAVLMDKAATKRMLAETGVPVLPFKEIKRPREGRLITAQELEAQLGNVAFPCCLKPAHLGSSIGVAQVKNMQEISDVLTETFRFDDTALLEPFVENLEEYNVAVCEKDGAILTSAIERPKCAAELLDFKTKYMPNGSGKMGGKQGTKSADHKGQASQGMLSLTRDINPELPKEFEDKIRKWAEIVFTHVAGTGAPRLDFLCNGKTREIWFNEANPCPGSFGYFLWEAAKNPILFTELLDHLIEEALACHARKQIPTDPTPVEARLFKRK
jgi:D-alanine-D-alanine ligase